MGVYKKSKEGIMLSIKVIPRASKSEIVGILNDSIKLKIKSPPVDGKANNEIIRFFSELFDIPKRDVSIVKGSSSSHKILLLLGVKEDEIKRFLADYA